MKCRFFEITWFSKTILNWKPFFLLVAYISFGFRVLRWTWNMGVHKGIPKSGSSKYRCFGSWDCFFLDISHRLKIETTHIFVNLAKKNEKTGPPTQDQPKFESFWVFWDSALEDSLGESHAVERLKRTPKRSAVFLRKTARQVWTWTVALNTNVQSSFTSLPCSSP